MARSWQDKLHPLLLGTKMLASILACGLLLTFYQPFIPELTSLVAPTKLASCCDMPCCKGKPANAVCCCKPAARSSIRVEPLSPLAASPAISDEAAPTEHCAKAKSQTSKVVSNSLTPSSLKNIPQLVDDSATTSLVGEKLAEPPLVVTKLMAPCPCSTALTLVNLYQQQIIAANVQAIKPPPTLSLVQLVSYDQPYDLTAIFDQANPRAPPYLIA